ncbi:MAG: RsmF rRNA methyltransferase first C-terminal domain-containing protein [Eubacteriales bacterium]|nr:RsmF rRNA methyltransferase first C-terminal domain-containing protein [Eubacteriales bacterium]
MGKEIKLPEAFEARMKTMLGEEYGAFRESFEGERVSGLRVNLLKAGREEFEACFKDRFGLRPVPWCREGFYYDETARPGRHPAHEAGAYYIQEPSAMAVVSLLDPKPGELVLDLCAAPGGKTTHAAGRLKGKGLLISNEIHPARAKILSQNVERMGIGGVAVTNEDPARLEKAFPEFFDCMIVDAPCSGEGMFRKDEQAILEWSPENVSRCARRQQEILERAAAMLKPGGRLVYSTCTFAPEEDEGTVAEFLEGHPEFHVIPAGAGNELPGLSKGRPEWVKNGSAKLSDTYRIWPHLAEGEGHYMALLQKDGKADGEEAGRKKQAKAPAFWKDRAGQKLVREFFRDILTDQAFGQWEQERWADRLLLYGEQLYAAPEGMPNFSGLRVLRPGLHLGTLKKNRLEPAHALALYLKPEQVRRQLRLDPESREARDYLAGSTLSAAPDISGWGLVCAGSCSAGWGKWVSGTVKNHYPKGLRKP